MDKNQVSDTKTNMLGFFHSLTTTGWAIGTSVAAGALSA